VVDDKLMSSMVGNVSMMVMRDQKTTYSVPNSVDNRTKIDLFSDFIE
jgi:phage terminase large subunit-like protein